MWLSLAREMHLEVGCISGRAHGKLTCSFYPLTAGVTLRAHSFTTTGNSSHLRQTKLKSRSTAIPTLGSYVKTCIPDLLKPPFHSGFSLCAPEQNPN